MHGACVGSIAGLGLPRIGRQVCDPSDRAAEKSMVIFVP